MEKSVVEPVLGIFTNTKLVILDLECPVPVSTILSAKITITFFR